MPKTKPPRGQAAKPVQEEGFDPNLLHALHQAASFPINLDLRSKPVTMSGHALGGRKPSDDSFSITVYGSVGGYAYPLGAVRFSRASWAKFKKTGNGFLKSLDLAPDLAKGKKKK